jgi:hypothetical protein
MKMRPSTIKNLATKIRVIENDPDGQRLVCLEVQENLLKRITYFERCIRNVRTEIGTIKRILRGGGDKLLSKEDARKSKTYIKHLSNRIIAYQHTLKILRDFGDALVFIYLDKWDIKPMSFKESPGFITGKRGTRLERKVLREGFKLGMISIMTDLTNCLRYGDIITVRNLEWGKLGLALFLELKSGKAKPAEPTRQEINVRKMIKYIHSDFTDELYGRKGLTMRRALVRSDENNRTVVNEVINEAISQGAAMRRAEKGVFYFASNVRREKDLGEYFGAPEFAGQPIVAFANDFKFSNTGYFPFTLSIVDPNALAMFYAGELVIATMVDSALMIDKFQEKEIECTLLDGQEYVLELKPPGDNEVGAYKVSSHFFNRLFIEFLSLDWFVSETTAVKDQWPELLSLAEEQIAKLKGETSKAAPN